MHEIPHVKAVSLHMCTDVATCFPVCVSIYILVKTFDYDWTQILFQEYELSMIMSFLHYVHKLVRIIC